MLIPAISLTLVFAAGIILGRLPLKKDLRQAQSRAVSLQNTLHGIKFNSMAIVLGEADEYTVKEEDGCYNVYAVKYGGALMLVKSFPKADDRSYALRCAEELVEKLNEQI